MLKKIMMQTKQCPIRWPIFPVPTIFSLKRALLVIGMIGGFQASIAQAQLDFLSANRTVTGQAGVYSPGDPITSYTGPYSYTATPGSPFANFSGNASGEADMVYSVTPQVSATQSGYVNAYQNSFLNSDEIYFDSVEAGFGSGGNLGYGNGSSSMAVSFSVLSPAIFDITLDGLGDPLGSASDFILSSLNQGVLDTANTSSLLGEGKFGVDVSYSGNLIPGNVYTLTVTSSGGGFGQFADGGGLYLDMDVTTPDAVVSAVPEPSVMACWTGLFVILYLVVDFARKRKIANAFRVQPAKSENRKVLPPR